jgi:aromatic ring-cleaving dioxygenase
MTRDASEITGYHAHVYFDAATRPAAIAVREEITERFRVELGRVHDTPVGPHPKAMYQVAFDPEELPKIVPWLMLNRAGLTVLVHPRTGNDVEDHETNPLWLGPQLALDIDFLRNLPT